MKSIVRSKKLTMAIALGLLGSLLVPMQTMAETKQATVKTKAPANPKTLRFVPPPPPPGDPPGGRMAGGASRGQCPAVQTSLTAIVPATEQVLAKGSTYPVTVTNVWGLTVQQHPTFWFYVPYQNGSVYPAEFVLQDSQENDVYRTRIELPQVPGIIGVSLPAKVAPLEVNKSYRWYFKVACTQQMKNSPYVEGVVQRINPSLGLAQQLQTANPERKAEIYAANGIWYDTLTTLAQLRFANPNNPTLATDWMNLLRENGLKDIVSAPLLDGASMR